MLCLPMPDGMWIIKQRGLVFSFGKDVVVNDVRSLAGQQVKIDSAEFKVLGVEHFAIACEAECSHGFGLLVELPRKPVPPGFIIDKGTSGSVR